MTTISIGHTSLDQKDRVQLLRDLDSSKLSTLFPFEATLERGQVLYNITPTEVRFIAALV